MEAANANAASPKDNSKEKQQHLYKVVPTLTSLMTKVIVIGDYAVGKTSIIKRYCEGYFTPNYKLTIGVDFAVKVVEWDENTNVSLQVRRGVIKTDLG